MDVLSLALIGNASAGYLETKKGKLTRGVFDKKTRREPPALRRTRCAMGFERQFGVHQLFQQAQKRLVKTVSCAGER